MVGKTQNDSLSACLLKEQQGNCTQYVTHMQTAFFRGQKQVCEHGTFQRWTITSRYICPRRKKEIR
jgi:hypothetical protein